MPYLVGTDEAGYGPNLGPLVISATVWRVDSMGHTDLYSRLRSVRRSNDQEGAEQIVVADSKLLYKPGKGLAGLERGVLAFLAALGQRPTTWRKIWRCLRADASDSISQLPWYQAYDDQIPVDAAEASVAAQAAMLTADCQRAACIPVKIESRAVFPPRFNQLVEVTGNKASALSQTTLELVRSVLNGLPADEPVHVVCDKHGGRNRYGPLLHAAFPEMLAVVRREGRAESVYQLGTGCRRREIVFRAGGEEFLPSALASMVSKYLRELAMQAFNTFWTARVSQLKPTAGYPLDARRFKRQIASAQRELGIDDDQMWRSR